MCEKLMGMYKLYTEDKSKVKELVELNKTYFDILNQIVIDKDYKRMKMLLTKLSIISADIGMNIRLNTENFFIHVQSIVKDFDIGMYNLVYPYPGFEEYNKEYVKPFSYSMYDIKATSAIPELSKLLQTLS